MKTPSLSHILKFLYDIPTHYLITEGLLLFFSSIHHPSPQKQYFLHKNNQITLCKTRKKKQISPHRTKIQLHDQECNQTTKKSRLNTIRTKQQMKEWRKGDRIRITSTGLAGDPGSKTREPREEHEMLMNSNNPRHCLVIDKRQETSRGFFTTTRCL